MRRTRTLLVVLGVAGLILAGCGDDDDDGGGDAAPDETTEPQDLSVVADDYEFVEAPTELEAGVYTLIFENQGEADHEFGLAEIGDTPIDQFATDFAPVLEGGPFPEYLDAVVVPQPVAAGETLETTITVPEGQYALFCSLDDQPGDEDADEEGGGGESEEAPQLHYELGMIQELTVTGGETDPQLPEADGTITARDYEFEIDVAAGEQTVNFVNEGPAQVHHAVFFAFTEGTEEAAAEAALDAFLASEDAPPPPEIDLAAGDSLPSSGVFSAGLGQTFETNFESGRTYAVVCFIQDRSGGPPHAVANDMTEVFTVE